MINFHSKGTRRLQLCSCPLLTNQPPNWCIANLWYSHNLHILMCVFIASRKTSNRRWRRQRILHWVGENDGTQHSKTKQNHVGDIQFQVTAAMPWLSVGNNALAHRECCYSVWKCSSAPSPHHYQHSTRVDTHNQYKLLLTVQIFGQLRSGRHFVKHLAWFNHAQWLIESREILLLTPTIWQQQQRQQWTSFEFAVGGRLLSVAVSAGLIQLTWCPWHIHTHTSTLYIHQ